MPRNFTVLFLNFVRDPSRSFTKVNHVQLDLFLQSERRKICTQVNTFKYFKASADEIEHVLDSLSIAHHSATMSFLTSQAKRRSAFITSESTTSTLHPKNLESESCIRT